MEEGLNLHSKAPQVQDIHKLLPEPLASPELKLIPSDVPPSSYSPNCHLEWRHGDPLLEILSFPRHRVVLPQEYSELSFSITCPRLRRALSPVSLTL